MNRSPTSAPGAGILAVDTYLPARVRHNDEWPAAVVDTWRQRVTKFIPRSEAAVDEVTPGVRLALEAILALKDDPFQGVRTVHVVADDEASSDLEANAARQVLASAGRAAEDVDLLISHPMVPDYMCVNPASAVHHKVGLRRETTAFGVDGVCTSFILQLDLAHKYITSGAAELVLATQSSACTRLMPPDEPFSPWFGDAGGAALLAPVDPGYGLLSTSFRTWGELCEAFCATVPDSRWWEGGRVVAHNADRAAARRMQLSGPDIGAAVVADALAKAGVEAGDVRLFACHQPAPWVPKVVRQLAGLDNAAILPTFEWTGNLSSVNIPMQLAIATREGMLQRGDIVVLFALASGMMAASAVLRWA